MSFHMNIKKLLILLATSAISLSVLAAAASTANQPSKTLPRAPQSHYVYIEGGAGYNLYWLQDFTENIPNGVLDNTADSSFLGNWALNAAIGYQFTPYLGAELGGIYNFESKADQMYSITYPDFDQISTIYSRVKIQPWYAYLAGKLSLPIANKLKGFAKLGVGYTHSKIDELANDQSDLTPVQENHNMVSYTRNQLSPMAGLGLSYDITENVYVSGQWLFFMSKVDNFYLTHTSYPNIFLIDLGYKFNI